MAPSPAGYAAVVAGDSTHMSHHSKAMNDHLRRYADLVNATPSALFQVSMTSIGTDKEHAGMA